MNNSNRLHAYLLYLFLFLSGFAGLGYEMVWTRMLSVGLGHEIVAVLAVVAAFFSGMALGSFSLDGSVSRSSRPGRWYAALETVVGIWSLALIALIPWACTR
jgi:spermidine synthase